MFIAFDHTLELCEVGLLVGLSVSEVMEMLSAGPPVSMDLAYR